MVDNNATLESAIRSELALESHLNEEGKGAVQASQLRLNRPQRQWVGVSQFKILRYSDSFVIVTVVSLIVTAISSSGTMALF